MLKSGEAILKKTPDMLPALKQAGVVDSGGRGLLFIYQGYAAVLRGEDISLAAAETSDEPSDSTDEWHDLSKNLTHIYCVNFELNSFRDDCDEHDLDSFRRRLNRIGDCVQVQGNLSGAKVHVHTDNPGSALEYGVELGELSHIQIDNLAEMKRALENDQNKSVTGNEDIDFSEKEPSKTYGMVAISMGKGFTSFFQDLNVDQIVEGGQTMNPSVLKMLLWELLQLLHSRKIRIRITIFPIWLKPLNMSKQLPLLMLFVTANIMASISKKEIL